MNMASPPTAGLSRAIDAYRAAPYVYGIGTPRLTRGDEAMLAGLRESKKTALAFAEWGLSDAKGQFFLADCIEAYRLLNGGHSNKVKSMSALPKPDKARKGLAEAASYFSKHGLRLRLRLDPNVPAAQTLECVKAIRDGAKLFLGPDPDALSEAIALLASLIDSTEDSKRSAKPTVSRNGDKASARLSAVGVLKGSIYRLSGSPNLKAVEDIAGVVLGITITADHVKNAQTPSEWFGYWGVPPKKSTAKVSIRQSTGGAK
jgi:hypothetical protein